VKNTCLLVLTEYTNVIDVMIDGRTDRHRMTAQAALMYSIARQKSQCKAQTVIKNTVKMERISIMKYKLIQTFHVTTYTDLVTANMWLNSEHVWLRYCTITTMLYVVRGSRTAFCESARSVHSWFHSFVSFTVVNIGLKVSLVRDIIQHAVVNNVTTRIHESSFTYRS